MTVAMGAAVAEHAPPMKPHVTPEEEAVARDKERRSWPREKRKRKPTNLTFPPEKLGDEHDPAPGTYRAAALDAGLSLAQWAERAMDEALTRSVPKSTDG